MSWLYVPGLPCSQKESELDASFLDSNTVLSVTSKGKSLQPRSLSRLWKQGSSIRRLSGMTCSPSMASLGVAEFVASLAASPASPGRPQENNKGLLTSDGSGLTLSESFARLNRHFASSKTCGDLFQEADLSSSLLTLPTSGSMWNGVLCRRPMLALTTSANESSSWPTVTTSEGNGVGKHGTGALDLRTTVGQWMTPHGMSGMDKTGKVGGGGEFAKQAQNWGTPTARDHKDGSTTLENTPENGLLGRQVLNFSHPVLSAIDGRELSPTTRTLGPRLNPAFACWLMGWPIWWTNPAVTNSVRSAMASYRSALQSHLSSLLGEQDLRKEAA